LLMAKELHSRRFYLSNNYGSVSVQLTADDTEHGTASYSNSAMLHCRL
jgi:hypothetical protein